jgi:hypothetical protein
LSSLRAGNMPGMFIVDVGDPVVVVWPDYLAVDGRVTGVDHSVTAMTVSRVNWTCSVSLETFDGFVEPSPDSA